MSGLWNQPGVPHLGWTCSHVEDLGSPSQTCQMCRKEIIRFVHFMTHLDYDKTLEVGCVCAGRMEGDYQAARDRDRVMKNEAARKQRVVAKINGLQARLASPAAWRRSAKGNPWTKLEGYHATIFGAPDGYQIIASFGAEKLRLRRSFYVDHATARLAASNVVAADMRTRVGL